MAVAAPEVVETRYDAEPTPAKFHASNAMVRGLMGPVGSGKSVACCMEILSRAFKQEPGRNGVRYSRWCAIRNTFDELKGTTLETWRQWVPEEVAPIRWGPPPTVLYQAELPDGTRVHLEVWFVAIDRPKDLRKMKSREFTGIWLNEACELSREVLTRAIERIGRYPSGTRGTPTWTGVIMDTNPCDDDHWYHDLAEVQKPDRYEFFRQPPAMIKRDGQWVRNVDEDGREIAENVHDGDPTHGLPDGWDYYERQIPGNTDEHIRVYVGGEYGYIATGKPIYPEWNDTIHVARGRQLDAHGRLDYYPGIPLVLGWDFGLTPACIIMQLSPTGQLRVLREYIGQNIKIRAFVNHFVKPGLLNDFPLWFAEQGLDQGGLSSWGDPSGVNRKDTDARTCFEELEAAGLVTQPARSQAPMARREAVAGFLTRITPQGDPALLVDPSCVVLIKGFNGGYRYRRFQVVGEQRYAHKADKNRFSHPHDALQYGAVSVTQVGGKLGRQKCKDPRRRRPGRAGDWMG